MSRRWILSLALAVAASGQQSEPKKDAKAPVVEEQAPPEEDASLAPKEYTFNPLQATKELSAGNFYFKKGNYRAAAHRFTEATKWNNTFAEAFLRLGDARAKQGDNKAAAEAYAKYLEVAPDAKDAGDVKKRIAKLSK